MRVGVEAIDVYTGPACIDVKTIFEIRGLDTRRFNNLMMKKKSVGIPCEDPVTNGVNSAKKIVDNLSEQERSNIRLLITATESGLDFGKSLSTYIHKYLNLPKNCRLIEMKQACYAGTAALQLAANYIASQIDTEAKALIVITDVAFPVLKNTLSEPSQAVGAASLLVSNHPLVLELDYGATGYYSFEVLDTARPAVNVEYANPDLSLISYLDCVENCCKDYINHVEDVDFSSTFDYFAFHTPYGGLVKGAHRLVAKKFCNFSNIEKIEEDFNKRVRSSLAYCVQTGNIYSASLYLALCSLINNTDIKSEKRVGLFSYGSGCSSEFYSGIITPDSKEALARMAIQQRIDNRYELTMDEYNHLLDLNQEWVFGIKDRQVNLEEFSPIYEHSFQGRQLLVLKNISNYHRAYDWS